MESRALNFILGLLTILSFIVSFVSEENRVMAMVIGFTLLVLIIASERNIRIQKLQEEVKRLQEKLKIHEQLIDIKKDVEILKQRIK